jgi:hypothetical protein
MTVPSSEPNRIRRRCSVVWIALGSSVLMALTGSQWTGVALTPPLEVRRRLPSPASSAPALVPQRSALPVVSPTLSPVTRQSRTPAPTYAPLPELGPLQDAFPVEHVQPPFVQVDDPTDPEAADVESWASAMLARSMRDDLGLSLEQREQMKRKALESRRKFRDTLDVLDGVSVEAPSIDEFHTEGTDGADRAPLICYFVLTGVNSHDRRVAGLHRTLGRSGTRAPPLVWFSDAPDALIKPVVLRSAFEDRVCRESLADETQLKGCRYQRNFYRALDATLIMARAVAPHVNSHPSLVTAAANTNETDFHAVLPTLADCDFFVKLSDDTIVVEEHMEWLLQHSGIDPRRDAVIAGKVERRSGYQFLSGGHPVVFTRRAFELWGGVNGIGAACEGTVIDHAPEKLKKFWWWGDDVLLSFCWFHAQALLSIRELPGTVSVNRFRDAPLPGSLWRRTVPPYGGNRTEEHRLLVSVHTYPYASPRQMFSFWRMLHKR